MSALRTSMYTDMHVRAADIHVRRSKLTSMSLLLTSMSARSETTGVLDIYVNGTDIHVTTEHI